VWCIGPLKNTQLGDYTRAGTGLVPGGATTMGVGEDAPPVDPFSTGSNTPFATQSQLQALDGAVNLYSGNISSSITRTAFSQAGVSNGGDVMAQTYRYDLLNRFVGSRAATGESLQAVSGMSGSDYAVTVGYDANRQHLTKFGTPETGHGFKNLFKPFKKQFPGRALHPKTIRQSVIANLLKQGNDLRIVQAFAGHKYPGSTEAYRQSGIEELNAGIQKYHPLNNRRTK
jgi:hypothetical protein